MTHPLILPSVTKWTPDGRRVVSGVSSGEFSLWNGLTFNFDTILNAHGSAIRCMNWSHNQEWMATVSTFPVQTLDVVTACLTWANTTCPVSRQSDDEGMVKYWQSNFNNVAEFQAHKNPVRDIA